MEKIGIFSFNSAGINYCSGPKKGFICKDSRFVGDVVNNFIKDQCDIVVIGLQESNMPNDGLIDHFQKSLQNGGYKILKVDKMVGLGAEGFLGFIRGLWLLVAYNNRNIKNMKLIDIFKTSCKVQKKGKGALGFHVQVQPYFGIEQQMIFATAHLPFLGNNPEKQFGLQAREECLEEIYELLSRKKVPAILFGDLNFRIQKYYKTGKYEDLYDKRFIATENQAMVIDQLDELTQFLTETDKLGEKGEDVLSYLFQNEIQDKKYNNPLQDYYLVPTCKLKTKRNVEYCNNQEKSVSYPTKNGKSIRKYTSNLNLPNENYFDPKCYSLQKKKIQRIPSFCDRILYDPQAFQLNKFKTLDDEGINLSDHRAIYGLFSTEQEKKSTGPEQELSRAQSLAQSQARSQALEEAQVTGRIKGPVTGPSLKPKQKTVSIISEGKQEEEPLEYKKSKTIPRSSALSKSRALVTEPMDKITSKIGIFSFNTSDYKYCDDGKCQNVDFVQVVTQFMSTNYDIVVVGIYEPRFIKGFFQRFRKSEKGVGEYFVKILSQNYKIIVNESIIKDDHLTFLLIAYRKYKNIEDLKVISKTQINCKKSNGISALLQLNEKTGIQQRFAITFGNLVPQRDVSCLMQFYKQAFSNGQYPMILFGDLNFQIMYDKKLNMDNDELIYMFEQINKNQDENEIMQKEYFELRNQKDVFEYALDKIYKDIVPKNIFDDKFFILPTCNLKKDRNPEVCFEVDYLRKNYKFCYEDTPSYCDRMIFSKNAFVPIAMETIDDNGIEKSSHRAILAGFEFI